MGVLGREGMQPLTDEFAEAYRKYRAHHKMGRPATRHRKGGMRGPLSDSIEPEKYRNAMRDALAAFSGKSERELTGVLQNVLAAEYRIDSPDHTSELPSLKTAQNILREPHSISLQNYEALLSWLEYEIFDVKRQIFEIENPSDDVADDEEEPERQSREALDRLKEKSSAYCTLQGLLLDNPEDEEYAEALSKEYSARVLVEAIQILNANDREHLLQEAHLLLIRQQFQANDKQIEARPELEWPNLPETDHLNLLIRGMYRTTYGRHPGQRDLCALISNQEQVRSTLAAEISARAPLSENDEDENLNNKSEAISEVTDFNLKGLITGAEGDVTASIVLDEYVGGLGLDRKKD